MESLGKLLVQFLDASHLIIVVKKHATSAVVWVVVLYLDNGSLGAVLLMAYKVLEVSYLLAELALGMGVAAFDSIMPDLVIL